MRTIEEAVKQLDEGDLILYGYVPLGSKSDPIVVIAEYSHCNQEMENFTLKNIISPLKPLLFGKGADKIFDTKLVEYDEVRSLRRYREEILFP